MSRTTCQDRAASASGVHTCAVMWNGVNPPHWMNILALVWLSISVVTAAGMAVYIAAGHRQKMAVMNFVWPLTALYFGPIAIIFWRCFGAPASNEGSKQPPLWRSAIVGDTHCGAGCALGDFAGEWIVFGTGLTIARSGRGAGGAGGGAGAGAGGGAGQGDA